MKLSESQLRNLIRKELKIVLEMHGRNMPHHEEEKMEQIKGMLGGAAIGSLGAVPFAIAQYLQTDPEMMEKVINFIQKTGDFVQGLQTFEEE